MLEMRGFDSWKVGTFIKWNLIMSCIIMYMQVCMVIWIVLFLHKAGIVDHVIHVGMSWTNISGYTTVTGRKSSSHLEKLVGRESSNSATNQQQHNGNNYGVSQCEISSNAQLQFVPDPTQQQLIFCSCEWYTPSVGIKRWIEKILGRFSFITYYILLWATMIGCTRFTWKTMADRHNMYLMKKSQNFFAPHLYPTFLIQETECKNIIMISCLNLSKRLSTMDLNVSLYTFPGQVLQFVPLKSYHVGDLVFSMFAGERWSPGICRSLE